MKPNPTRTSILGRSSRRSLLAALLSFAPLSLTVLSPSARAMEIGMNVTPINDYAAGFTYSDIVRNARLLPAEFKWGGYQIIFNPPDSLIVPTRADGWPSASTITSGGTTYYVAFFWDNPALPKGDYTYVISGTGSGTAKIVSANDSDGSISTDLVADGTYKTGTFYHKGGKKLNLYLLSGGTDYDVQIFLPGTYDAQKKSAPFFYPAYTNRLADFTVLRYLDWFAANNNNYVIDWATRAPKATDRIHTRAPIEHMVAIANQLQKDIWLTIPLFADGTGANDYIDQTAKIIEYGSDGVNAYTTGAWNQAGKTWQGLDPKLKVYVEYSNEIWNNSWPFTQGNNAAQLGVSKWNELFPNNPKPSDWGEARFFWLAYRSAQIWEKFYSAVSNDNRVVRVAPGQANWVDGSLALMLKYLYSSTFNPNSIRSADVVSVAPYISWNLTPQVVDNFDSGTWGGGSGSVTWNAAWSGTADPSAPALVQNGVNSKTGAPVYKIRLDGTDTIARGFPMRDSVMNSFVPAEDASSGLGGFFSVNWENTQVGDKLYADFKLGAGEWVNYLELHRNSSTQITAKRQVGTTWNTSTYDTTKIISAGIADFGPTSSSSSTGEFRLRTVSATGSTGYWDLDNVEVLLRPSTAQTLKQLKLELAATGPRLDTLRTLLASKTEYANLRIALYEGGQHLVPSGSAQNDSTLAANFANANRDPAIHKIYLDYLDTLESKGVDTFVHYNYAGTYTKNGSFPVMETLDQILGDPNNPGSTPNATYKYPALVGWIQGNLYLRDTFDDGNYKGWSIVLGASGWSVTTDGKLKYTGDAPATGYHRNILAYGGTGSSNWTDYTLRATVRPVDDDVWGFVFFYGGSQNYYGVEFTKDVSVTGTAGKRANLYRVTSGYTTSLGTTTDFDYDPAQDNVVEISVDAGAKTIVRLNGKQVFSEDTPSNRTQGTVGVYTFKNDGLLVDEIQVRQHVLTLPLQQN